MARWELQEGENEIMRVHPSMMKLVPPALRDPVPVPALVHRPDLPEPRDQLDRHEPPADRRVGVFNQTTVSIGLERVQEVQYIRTFWDRLIGTGSLEVVNAGDDEPVHIGFLRKDQEFRDALHERDRRAPARAARAVVAQGGL